MLLISNPRAGPELYVHNKGNYLTANRTAIAVGSRYANNCLELPDSDELRCLVPMLDAFLKRNNRLLQLPNPLADPPLDFLRNGPVLPLDYASIEFE